MLMGDHNPLNVSELNGKRFNCDDITSAEAHLDLWSKARLTAGDSSHFKLERLTGKHPCLTAPNRSYGHKKAGFSNPAHAQMILSIG